jgi:hypothetical protein
MFKQRFGTYSKQQSPSIQQMQTLYFEMAKQCCLEKRDVLHLTERTDTCLGVTYQPLCLQRSFRLAGLQIYQTTPRQESIKNNTASIRKDCFISFMNAIS